MTTQHQHESNFIGEKVVTTVIFPTLTLSAVLNSWDFVVVVELIIYGDDHVIALVEELSLLQAHHEIVQSPMIAHKNVN